MRCVGGHAEDVYCSCCRPLEDYTRPPPDGLHKHHMPSHCRHILDPNCGKGFPEPQCSGCMEEIGKVFPKIHEMVALNKKEHIKSYLENFVGGSVEETNKGMEAINRGDYVTLDKLESAIKTAGELVDPPPGERGESCLAPKGPGYEERVIPHTFEAALDLVLAEMRVVMLDRQRKYGPNNILRTGIHGLITRINDKLARIEEDHKDCYFSECGEQRELPDEGQLDAWLDLANYSGPIGMMLQKGWWGLPLEGI